MSTWKRWDPTKPSAAASSSGVTTNTQSEGLVQNDSWGQGRSLSSAAYGGSTVGRGALSRVGHGFSQAALAAHRHVASGKSGPLLPRPPYPPLMTQQRKRRHSGSSTGSLLQQLKMKALKRGGSLSLSTPFRQYESGTNVFRRKQPMADLRVQLEQRRKLQQEQQEQQRNQQNLGPEVVDLSDDEDEVEMIEDIKVEFKANEQQNRIVKQESATMRQDVVEEKLDTKFGFDNSKHLQIDKVRLTQNMTKAFFEQFKHLRPHIVQPSSSSMQNSPKKTNIVVEPYGDHMKTQNLHFGDSITAKYAENCFGSFIKTDSKYGNSIMPVLPRLPM